MELTAKELHLLRFTVERESSFNFDIIDITKSFDEQSWEAGDAWYGYPELREYVAKYGEAMGVDVKAAKGGLGSLFKKGFFCDGGDGMLCVGHEEFSRICEALNA